MGDLCLKPKKIVTQFIQNRPALVWILAILLVLGPFCVSDKAVN